MGGIHRLTGMHVDPNPNIIGIMDPDLFKYPFLYAVEVGGMYGLVVLLRTTLARKRATPPLQGGENKVEFVGPDSAIIVRWNARQVFRRIQARRNLAARICSHQDYRALSSVHTTHKTIGPTPEPWRDVDRDKKCGVVAAGRHNACP